jgi:hypothetical protein
MYEPCFINQKSLFTILTAFHSVGEGAVHTDVPPAYCKYFSHPCCFFYTYSLLVVHSLSKPDRFLKKEENALVN